MTVPLSREIVMRKSSQEPERVGPEHQYRIGLQGFTDRAERGQGSSEVRHRKVGFVEFERATRATKWQVADRKVCRKLGQTPFGGKGSGRRQGVSATARLRRPRLSTWRLFLSPGPTLVFESKRGSVAVCARAPPSVMQYRVHAPVRRGYTLDHARSTRY